jgi:hypothetical protein
MPVSEFKWSYNSLTTHSKVVVVFFALITVPTFRCKWLHPGLIGKRRIDARNQKLILHFQNLVTETNDNKVGSRFTTY